MESRLDMWKERARGREDEAQETGDRINGVDTLAEPKDNGGE